MDTRDPIEVLRECLKYEHAFDLLREKLSVELKPGWHLACLDKFANEIEAQYMRLPVDADGVPIRLGDEISIVGREDGVAASIEINDRGFAYVGVRPHGWSVPTRCTPEEVIHVKPETVEDIISEVYHLVREAEDERGLIADYAERIRKAVEQ